MDRRLRYTLAVVVAVQAVVGLLVIVQSPLVSGAIWPFEGMTPLSWIFVGSIFAAVTASTSWCLLVGSERGLAGIALDHVAILAPFSILGLATLVGGASIDVAIFAAVSAVGAFVGVAVLRWSLRRPWRDPRAMPRLVRWSFGVFVVALVALGSLLVIRVPSIMPWQVTPELSTLFGLTFLGAATYFAFGVLEPRWENAGGQLAGFLAYDLVLIVPFLQRLPTVSDELRLNLFVYTGVLIFSGLLAIWFLLVDRRTRLGSARVDDAVPIT